MAPNQAVVELALAFAKALAARDYSAGYALTSKESAYRRIRAASTSRMEECEQGGFS